MIVSLGFGLRIRSLDVLTSLRVEAVEAEGSPQVDVEDVEPWVRPRCERGPESLWVMGEMRERFSK